MTLIQIIMVYHQQYIKSDDLDTVKKFNIEVLGNQIFSRVVTYPDLVFYYPI